MSPVKLSAVNSTLLPADVISAIFVKANESSAVMSLARKIPLSVSATTAIPVPGDVPEAQWVTEGGVKPEATSSVGVKTMAGKKVAVLVPVSEEVANTNPAGLYDQLVNDLPTAIARAFDFAAIHGETAGGGASPFSDSLTATSNSVTLGTASAATGGIYTDLVNGEADVVNNNFDFNGFAASPRLLPQIKLSTDSQGHPLFVPNLASGTGAGQLDGFPVSYSRGVDGAYRRQAGEVKRTVTDGVTHTSTTVDSATAAFTVSDIGKLITGTGIPTATTITAVTADGAHATLSAAATASATGLTFVIGLSADTLVRAIGGDWSQCAWGEGMSLTIKQSTQASYADASGVVHSAFQENLVLILAEAYYGFIVADNNAFVKYLHS